MTSQQSDMTRRLSDELVRQGENGRVDWRESENQLTRGFLFGEVAGVTVTVAPTGLVNIPAVRTYHPPEYPTPVNAAASAGELWAKQKVRDDTNPELARSRRTGHLGPIIDYNLKCRNNACPCAAETGDERRRRERGGFNENPFRCA
jgi:hypothetical protein